MNPPKEGTRGYAMTRKRSRRHGDGSRPADVLRGLEGSTHRRKKVARSRPVRTICVHRCRSLLMLDATTEAS